MDEKKQTEQEPETPAEDNGDGDKSELAKETDSANAAAERMEKATEELNAAEARRRLGGTAEAGQTPKKQTEDEKWAEGAKERYAGTGMDPTDDDSPTEYA
jgi:hypothetical protein